MVKSEYVRKNGETQTIIVIALFLIISYNISRKLRISYLTKEWMSMITKIRKKAQVTIPKELVTKLGIEEGDKIEITEKDGVIQIIPVVVYPKKYLESLKEEIDEIKGKIKSGDHPVFDNVDDLFKILDEEGLQDTDV